MMRSVSAILVFVCVSVCIAIAGGCIVGAMGAKIAVGGIFAGVVCGVWVFFNTREEREEKPVNRWDIILFLVFAFVAWRSFFWLLFLTKGGWYVLSHHNLGDMSLHVNLIRYLAHAKPFWPDSPILTGVKLTYPLGMDLFNAQLLNLHVGLQEGLIWAGVIASVVTAYCLWKWGRAFALAMFLFNGGLLGVMGLFVESVQEERWKNFFLTLFVTQRGWLYALPASLLLLWSWRQRLENKKGILKPVEWLLYVTMPLFNVHAFLYLSAVLAFAWIFHPARRWKIARFVALSFIPATICMALVTNGFRESGGIHFKIGWMQGNEGILFWILNFGISLPVVAVVCGLVWRKRDAIAFTFAGAAIFVFTLCIFISFAPWEWDNTKLMMLAWLSLAPFLWKDGIGLTPVPVRVLICFLFFASGAVMLWKGVDGSNGYKLIEEEQIDSVQYAIENVPLNERFACVPGYSHPLFLLGRPVVAGYEGHLWSHGLNYKPVWGMLRSLMNGEEDWKDDARTLEVHYLFWGPQEEATYPNSQRPWEDCAKKIAETEWGTVWDLRPCLGEK